MKKNKITQELKRISKKHGGILKPEIVVNEAENEKSILHSCFEWDDTKAGRAYRLWQARQLISVSVEYSEETKKYHDVWVHLSSDNVGYREVEQVLPDKTLRQIMLNDALNEMNLFINKYNDLKELAQVFEVMTLTTAKYATKNEIKGYTIHPHVSPIA